MKQITDISDARLVKGLAHPLRIEILHALRDGAASPTQIANRLGAPLGNVSYHVRFLARVGLIELCDTRPRRGAVEHYYRTIDGVRLDHEAWATVPGPVRDSVHTATLREVGRAVGAAAARGGFSHDAAHATRLELALDPVGLTELSAAVAELRDRAEQISRESVRRAVAGGDRVHTELVVMVYGAGDSPETAAEPAESVVGCV